jgi:exopolyphosphatase/pppGpp-phosphohydrolase
MSIDTLTTLLREAQHEVHRHQYTHALKIIRDAKIFDLHNVYLSALEHFVTKLPYPSSPDFTEERSMENEHILSLLIDRAIHDRVRRETRRNEGLVMPDERTLVLEKIKNLYFQRTDQYIEAKEFGRALEEIQRIYYFDPLNIVAKEYQLKIGQLAELHKKG